MPDWRFVRAGVGVLLMVLTCASACRRADSSHVAIDLLQQFPYTSSGKHAPRIDFGKPGAEAYLLHGWSPREVLPSGESVVRGIQRRAALQFVVNEPAERRLIVHCALLSRRAARPQKVMIRLNGRWLVPILPKDGFNDFAVTLPAAAQRPGRNLLEFSHRTLPRRARADFRTLDTVAYEWMAIERDDGRPEAPFVVWDGTTAEALVMPASSQVDFFLRVPAASDLTFETATAGRVAARLAVVVQSEGKPEQTLWNQPSSVARIDLGAYAGAVVRLSVRAEGDGMLRLIRPRIVTLGVGPLAGPAPPAGTPTPYNVVLYIVDTLRADHLGRYGYPRPTSPHIDAFAADATLFSNVVAQSSWTRPSTASILTGLFPYTHGAVTITGRLRPGVVTLAEVLQAHGYETAAFITNVNVSGPFGFRRGFQSFTYLPEDEARTSIHVLSNALNDVVFPWLETPHPHPFFLYVHATDPHAPYTPPAALAERFRDGGAPSLAATDQPLRRLLQDPGLVTTENVAYIRSLYDGEIAFLDANFGRFVEELKRLNLYDHTIIVVTADHGEEFHEHGGFEHGHTLYQEQLRVPLIMRVPSIAEKGTRVPGLVRQVDIMPTLLDTLGVPIPEGVQGTTLRSPAGTRPAVHEAFAQTSLGGSVEVTALVTETWKVVQKKTADRRSFELYQLDSDVQESKNTASENPVLLGYAQQAIEQWTAGTAPSGDESPSTAAKEPLDKATAERLRILGYTQ